MKERVVYINGQFLPESEGKISFLDKGFFLGDAVFDTARTFKHKPYKFKEHIERLYRSLRYVRIDPGMDEDEMMRITLEVLAANVPLLKENDDYWVTQSVSSGLLTTPPTDLRGGEATVVICCRPICFKEYAEYFKSGIGLVTPSIRDVPPQCLDPKIKARNYLNHIIADLEAKQVDPHATPLLLDINGYVTETLGANFFLARGGELMTPGRHNILCGISRQTVTELAKGLDIPVIEDNYITVYDVYNADEAFLTTTSYNMAPVSHLNGVKIGKEIPGPLTKRFLDAWSESVGVDIVGQFLSHLEE